MTGSVASFGVSRLKLSRAPLLTNAALLTYAIPASFLIVPYYRIMNTDGLSDKLWAVLADANISAAAKALGLTHQTWSVATRPLLTTLNTKAPEQIV